MRLTRKTMPEHAFETPSLSLPDSWFLKPGSYHRPC